jgi:hypothetical protein
MRTWTRFVVPGAAALAAGALALVLGGALDFPAVMTIGVSGAASIGAGALSLQSCTRRASRLAMLERRRRELTSEDVLRHVIVGDARRI